MAARRGAGAVGALLAVTALCGCLPVSDGEPPRPLEGRALLTAYDESLDERWTALLDRYPGAERPESVAPQEVGEASWRNTIIGCLHAAGFEVAEVPGGLGWRGGAEVDLERLAVAQFDCTARYPFEGTLDALLSIDERTALYGYYSGFLVPCLSLAGVDVARPPDEADFVASSVNGPSWHPYLSLAGRAFGGPAYDAVDARCPLRPDWQR